jgi:carbon monoxide dehydrogenase subunit G
MIEVNERIDVQAAPQTVWAILSDPRAVTECVEGAELGERHEDGSYDAKLVVKFGPARVSFKTRFTLDLDEATMSGKVASRGKDNQGGTRVTTSMSFTVAEGATPGSSTIPINAQVEISGKLASLVESGANIVVKRMTADFTQKLAAKVGGTAVASNK